MKSRISVATIRAVKAQSAEADQSDLELFLATTETSKQRIVLHTNMININLINLFQMRLICWITGFWLSYK